MLDPVSVVVPARDEAATIGKVVARLTALPWVDEVVVVDNGSEDDTAGLAAQAGAVTVFEERPGMGHAVRAGIGAARHDWVMKLDADLDKFDTSRFALMPAARGPGIGLVKGAWHDPKDNMPMTRLLVMPAIRQMFPGLSYLNAPNSGIYLVDRRWIAHQELVGNYAADLDVMLRVHASGAAVAEVDIGRIAHDPRDLGHYNSMAEEIMAFFLMQTNRRITEELVVMAEDAGQVIDSSLGVLAARSKFGGPVSVFLNDFANPATGVLQSALSPFPTARVLPLEDAAGFAPVGPSGDMRLFAPYPVAGEDLALRTALRTQVQLPSEPELLLMPQGPGRGAVGGFRPDVALDVGEGADIKRAAIERLRHRIAAHAGPREMFQTYASLPDALRVRLQPDPHIGAGNM